PSSSSSNVPAPTVLHTLSLHDALPIYDALIDQLLEDGRALLGTFAVDARLAEVITAVSLGKDVAIVGRQQRPGEIGVVVIPENGALAVCGQLLVNGEDFIEVRWRRRDQRLVVDQRRRFDRHGIAPQLAVVTHGIPGEVGDITLAGGTGVDRRDQPALRPFAEPIMGPDEDVRSVAGGGGLLKLVRRRIR